jgi:replicative superfamily II helicase
MVDFKKRLAKGKSECVTDPIALYDTLDRQSDKGPLRPVQKTVLTEWDETYRSKQDVILKLQTGQGKTLIGLLILQARLNEGHGPAIYLCPNHFLVNQTCEQASQFGIQYCRAEHDLPDDFLNSKKILITLVHTLFNGLTRFGLGKHSEEVNTIVIDDAHACVDAIRNSFIIKISSEEQSYSLIRDLFASDLENQGMGTFADIKNGQYSTLLPVPYWAWHDKHAEVASILSKSSKSDSIKFAWPLIKDMIDKCQCVVSGKSLEIAPYLPPLNSFGSYTKASHRVFMSATVADDSFLIKGLGLSPDTIKNPLTYSKEKWSGEKMILVPSLIDESLDRAFMVKFLAPPKDGRRYGIVALVPGFEGRTGDWKAYGAVVATKKTIDDEITNLRENDRSKTLVIANRYDGIDLPDSSCRILILDSRPYSENLIDMYAESCRSESEITTIRIARSIEQGLGRSVRGEKDYCIIIILGPDLIKYIRSKVSRKFLSNQTRQQIQIGLDIAQMAKEEMDDDESPQKVLFDLMSQCLRRDVSWKAYYAEQMDSVKPEKIHGAALELFTYERDAELKYLKGDADGAAAVLQTMINTIIKEENEQGWYLQEMARYLYPHNKTESNKLQIAAHQKNHSLMKPLTGMAITKLVISQQRMENIIKWVNNYTTFEELRLASEEILSHLSFGVKADTFENALDNLAGLLGFVGQRPEKEWKEGPDNLWGIRDGEFLLIECKDEVALNRADINEKEAEQMNRSCAWFDKHYAGATVKNVMIIPTRNLSRKTLFTHPVHIIKEKGLGNLVRSVRAFVTEFSKLDLKDLSEKKVQGLVNLHMLSVDDILNRYTEPAR